MKFINSIKSFISKRSFGIEDFLFIIAIIAIFLLGTHRGCNSPYKNIVIEQPKLTPVKNRVDKVGTSYSEIKEQTFTKDQMKLITDSLRRVLGKSKVTTDIQYVSRIDTVFVTDSTLKIDNINHTIYDYKKDNYLLLEYTGDWINKVGKFNLSFTPDTQTIVIADKRRFLRSTEQTINVYHSNPYYRNISVGKAYTTKIGKPIIIVGPYVGIDLLTMKPSIGVSATFNLFSIKTK